MPDNPLTEIEISRERNPLYAMLPGFLVPKIKRAGHLSLENSSTLMHPGPQA